MANPPAEGVHRSHLASAPPDPGGVNECAWQYSFIKAGSSSPLRDDQERCLADLDNLIPVARALQDPAATVLALEMEDRHRQLLDALRLGREL